MIPLVDLKGSIDAIGDGLQARLRHVLDQGRFILGPEVGELEERLAAQAGAGAAVGVASGTDALKIALLSRGIGAGDAVFVPAFTFIATAEAVAALGATPIFVDIGWDDMTMDAEDLKSRIQAIRKAEDLRAAAVIPVDLFGQPARYEEILPIAEEEDLVVIGDAAQSYGARLGNRSVGTLAPVTALSFYPTKPLGCFGDGGALLCVDPEDAVIFRELRQHGFDAGRRESRRVGFNSRLDTMQAAVLLSRLDVFEAELEKRNTIARTYAELLSGTVEVPRVGEDRTSAWAVYSIRTPRRDAVREKLSEAGIASAIYYDRPICDHPAYADYRQWTSDLANSRRVSREVLALPMHPYLSQQDVERIAETVKSSAG